MRNIRATGSTSSSSMTGAPTIPEHTSPGRGTSGPQIVQAVRLPVNGGKRGALAAAFARATGEILVTVDSDSVIERGALLTIAGPFRNERVGVVAGKVCVLNRFRSLLPRMLHVRFVLSFDFLRNVQSTYGTVYCCPGALSAYRASVIKPLIPSWLRQRFLGAGCTIGEDRALTNDVLAAGYQAVYQRSAVVHTIWRRRATGSSTVRNRAWLTR